MSPGLTRRFTEAHDARLSGWGDSNTRFSAAGPQSPSGQQPDPVATTDNTTHHFDSGIQLTAATTGMAAMQSITPTGSELSASDQDSVLSPTLYPAANSCIEVTTVANSDGYSVSPFDWCGYPSGARGWQPGRKIDASFLSTYMTSSYGLPSYWVQIRQTNPATNTWTAYLYNFQTKAWDSLYSSSGATGKPGIQGWDIAEFYSTSNPATSTGYFCTETRGMAWESNDIMLLVNGKFTWASASNSRQVPGGGANCPLSYKVIATNSHWRVQNVS
ncbi:MAG TPA: hypothetical protein VG317_04335 [Pseudonocardiaceae bacterium]|nr:hypothetical protein [Pseudonocardiaceae bacterium]